MTAENRNDIFNNMLTCIACGVPTLMTYRKGEAEAAFCPAHVPGDERRMHVQITISVNNYF